MLVMLVMVMLVIVMMVMIEIEKIIVIVKKMAMNGHLIWQNRTSIYLHNFGTGEELAEENPVNRVSV